MAICDQLKILDALADAGVLLVTVNHAGEGSAFTLPLGTGRWALGGDLQKIIVLRHEGRFETGRPGQQLFIVGLPGAIFLRA